MPFALSISALFNSLLQLVNGPQFLNITPLFLLSAFLDSTSPVSVIAIVSLTSI